MTHSPYTIYAVQYARRETTSTELFYGDYHNTPMKMTYFVWALVNDQHTVVVDLGFTEEVGTRRGREFMRCPSVGLAELGIDCASVSHVIVSHMHYDHVGNYDLFPNATFYLQEDEMRFYTGKYVRHAAFRRSIEVDDVVAMVRYNYEGRLTLVDGVREIVPGVHVHRVGGHTAGLPDRHRADRPGAGGARHGRIALLSQHREGRAVHGAARLARHVRQLRAHAGTSRQAGPDRSWARSLGSGTP